MDDKTASVPHLSARDCSVATDRLVPGAKSAPDPEKGQLQPEAAEEMGQYLGMCKPTGPSPVGITLLSVRAPCSYRHLSMLFYQENHFNKHFSIAKVIISEKDD